MYLTDLAQAARKSGLRVVEQPGWRTRGHGGMNGRPRSIMCHHTAGPSRGNAPSLGVVQNGRPGLEGPLAQIVLGRDGTVFIVAAGRCWHAGPVADPANFTNSWSIGIEAEATGTSAWPAVQMNAYVRLTTALCAHYGIPVSRVQGHKEQAVPRGRKPDPNFDMSAFRRKVAAQLGKPMPSGSAPSSTPSGKSAITGLLTEDGLFDEGTAKALQRFLGTDDDGDFGPKSIAALQRHLHIADDGVIGPVTLAAMARGFGTTATAWHRNRKGDPMTLAIEKWWNREYRKLRAATPGSATPAIPAAAKAKPTEQTVTGVLDTLTIRNLQSALNIADLGRRPDVAVTGVLDRETITKLQWMAGAEQTGRLDGQTGRAMEEWLNRTPTAMDGLSRDVVRALQRWIMSTLNRKV